jgi:intergrase/recombinase
MLLDVKYGLEPLKRYVDSCFNERTIARYAIRHGLLASKYMRKVSWRLMIKAMPKEVARFIQSRFGELKISEARYEDLLSEADEYYQKYLVFLQSILQ